MVRYTFLLLAVCASITLPAVTRANDSSVHYAIAIQKQSDRIDLNISMQFHVTQDTAFFLPLIKDNYGISDIHRFITKMEGYNGTVVTAGSNDENRKISPNKTNEVYLRYTISYPPDLGLRYSFAPNVTSEYFDLAGCQWMLPLNAEQVRHYTFRFTNLSDNLRGYSSISHRSDSFSIRTSYNELMSSRLGVVPAQKIKTFSYKGKPFKIALAGNFMINDDHILRAIREIVVSQRRWFNDNSQPYYLISVNERSGIIAGTAGSRFFVCFIKPDITAPQLKYILAHEMTHQWMPGKIYIRKEKGERSEKYEWFSEGFTDYISRRILLDAKLIRKEEFVEKINDDIEALANNRFRHYTVRQIDSLIMAGGFSSEAKKLSYFRGALLAFKWDLAIQKHTKKTSSIKAMIMDLISYTNKKSSAMPLTTFDSIAQRYGLSAQFLVKHFIEDGNNIQFSEEELYPYYRLKYISKPLFYPGFDIARSFDKSKISGVDKAGPAYRAGLREGMLFTAIENASRFINSWSKDRPVTVTIIEEGRHRMIRYHADGPLTTLQNIIISK
jgi:predicted metalloprotease with PDZ domain